MRLLKIIYFETKQLYSKWSITFWLALVIFNAIIMISTTPLTGHNARALLSDEAFELLNIYLLTFLPGLLFRASMSHTVDFIVKSTVDFVFTTPVDPMEYYVARALANGLIYPAAFAAATAPFVRLGVDAAYYVLILILLAGFFMIFTANVSILPRILKLPYALSMLLVMILGVLRPRLSPLYGLINPNPTYSAYALALMVIAIVTIPKSHIVNLATNAYEVLSIPAPTSRQDRASNDIIKPINHFPRSTWGIIWFTSTRTLITHGSRANSLKVLIPLSTVTAAVYIASIMLFSRTPVEPTANPIFVNWKVPLSAISFAVIYLDLLMILMITVSGERLWLSLSIDPTQYFRLRMLARTLIAAIALLPWITAYLIQGIYFRPTMYLALALIAAILIAPPLSWLIAAYIGIPQTRELGMPQRPEVLTLNVTFMFLFIFISLGIFMTPYFLDLLAGSVRDGLVNMALNYAGITLTALLITASVAFFYLVVLSEKGRGIWFWLVNKLSEDGYV